MKMIIIVRVITLTMSLIMTIMLLIKMMVVMMLMMTMIVTLTGVAAKFILLFHHYGRHYVTRYSHIYHIKKQE